MSTITPLLKELEQEAQTTRKMLERVPTAYFSWQPHKKSMTVKQLATHIAELPSWVTMAVTTDGLDFAANPYQQEEVGNTADLLSYFERSLEDGRTHLEKTNEDILAETWTLRNGGVVLHEATKGEIIRMAYCQIVHHRAQLGVFLRLLDIPIPGSYGPSADEHEN
ncbi:MAG: DinB family protein [Bacteroidetes bacterium]|nr:DinB family protein [Bacteroidota bacterium]